MSQKRKLTFPEKVLMSTKKHKVHAKKHSIIAFIICFIILASTSFIRQADVPTVAKEDDSVFTASLVGDIMFGRHVEKVAERHGYDHMFAYTKPYFEAADYVTGNLTSPVLDEESSKPLSEEEISSLVADKEAIKTLEDADFSVVNLANNHSFEIDSPQTKETLEAIDESDVEAVGIATDYDAAQGVSYTKHNGLEVATVGVTDVVAPSNAAAVLTTDPNEALPLIREARSQADLVVVHVHAGQEYDSSPTTRQETLMKAFADAGADIVIGHYPHVLQSVDVYNDTLILYSIGNFVFDQGWTRTRDTAIAQYNLKEDGTAEVELVPFRIYEAQPKPVEGALSFYHRGKIFRQLTKDTENTESIKQQDDRLIFEVDHSHVLARMDDAR
ncbi:CapA family protein [Alkalihalophilus pseudofirmus]|jgi:poly-gamma-glutamate synthesis protein (capsule biosynthesis protein)|uniref:CapA family protein n=1 Tax=Alkalihalophilus pseudofirmus TaxID=79885 RepID=A0AAJ2NQ84_ALKPS|nr:CapA family protein [Alkalihalophilus pseudofirmus]MDV2886418.1 CapA family protein [Alkalihalophilus pseudofirmus]